VLTKALIKSGLEEGLKIRKKALGNDHPDVAGSLNNIGSCLCELGRYKEALERHEEGLKIRKKALGNDHPDVAGSLNNIGSCLYGSGRYEEALIKGKEAFITACRCFKQEHPDIVFFLRNIVFFLKKLDNKDINEATKKELLPLCIEYLGENHGCTRSLSGVEAKASCCVIQ